MERIWKLGYLCTLLLLFLIISKKYSISELSMKILTPNYASAKIQEGSPVSDRKNHSLKDEEQRKAQLSEIREQQAEEKVLSFQSLLEDSAQEERAVSDTVLVYSETQLEDQDFLISHIYNVDSSTKLPSLDVEKLRNYDFKVNHESQGPEILIYHTHSQEAFADSTPGDPNETIMGMGAYLAQLLEEQGYEVLHHQGIYDMENGVVSRNQAYQRAEPEIQKILEENPSIQLVIDLHRDGVGETTHLVTEIDGKPVAKIMFFNGLSYSAINGEISYLPNPYIENNLALTLQMKLASDSMYPGFARKIYLKSLRFNLHLHPAAMLIEAGAQTNTLEEERNAMEVLARVLGNVLQ